MVTRQPHHEQAVAGEDDEDRTGQEGPCGDVAAYALGVLDPAEHVLFSRHLAGCETCRFDAADFGLFAPVLRPVLGESADPPGVPRLQCRITRGIVLVAAGFVVAVAAVLSVVESLSSHVGDPVDVGTLTRAAPAHDEQFAPLRRM